MGHMCERGASGIGVNDAKVMAGIMRSMGVEQWEPRVINQYLEIMYRT